MRENHFTKLERKILILSSLGGMLEFYDFIIYGVFSAYFASQFFPTENTLMAIIESYVVFVIGYIVRPIGGIIFSHIGDEKGRKQVLITTVVLMGISSLGIGILPTHTKIGVAAPILLIIFRLLQGVAIGGELPSTYVYIRESITTKPVKAFGIVMTGIVSGLLLGMIINYVISHIFTYNQISNYGWRIPFILGGVICLISYKIRQQLQETVAFKSITGKSRFPILDLFKSHTKELFLATFITGSLAISIVTFIIFMPTYLVKIIQLPVAISSSTTLGITIITLIISLLSGYIIENLNININKTIKLSLLPAIIIIGFVFFLLNNHSEVSLVLILGIVVGFYTAISPAIITTLFPTKIRLTGVALSYNLGFTIFGGLAPVVITSLIKSGMNKFIAPFSCVAVVYFITFILLALLQKKSYAQ